MARTFRKRTGGRRKRRTRRSRRRHRGGRRLEQSEINQIKRESRGHYEKANKAAADLTAAAREADKLERHARTAGIPSICNTLWCDDRKMQESSSSGKRSCQRSPRKRFSSPKSSSFK